MFRLPPVFLNRPTGGSRDTHTRDEHTEAHSHSSQGTQTGETSPTKPTHRHTKIQSLKSHNRSDPQKHGEDQITQNTHDPP